MVAGGRGPLSILCLGMMLKGAAAAPKLDKGLLLWDNTMGSKSSLARAATVGVAALAAVGSVAAAENRGRPRSPLREGYAVKRLKCEHEDHRQIVRAEAVKPVRAEPPTSASAAPSGSREEAMGEDSLGLRRATAPQWKNKKAGSMALAKEALANPGAEARAMKELEEDVFARSTVGPRQRKWKVLGKIAAAAEPRISLVPTTPEDLKRMAAALKAGNYRTGDKYLLLVKKAHIEAGSPWTDLLQSTLKDVSRSLTRGIGLGKVAPTFGLEKLAAKGMPSGPSAE